MAKEKKSESPLEKEVINIIKKYNRTTQMEITKEDMKNILDEMMPMIDELIAKQVKKHFNQIGLFLAGKFNKEGE